MFGLQVGEVMRPTSCSVDDVAAVECSAVDGASAVDDEEVGLVVGDGFAASCAWSALGFDYGAVLLVERVAVPPVYRDGARPSPGHGASTLGTLRAYAP